MQLAEVKLGYPDNEEKDVRNTPVQVIAITGGGDGVGKTSVAVNLAFALAREGLNTMLLDADLGMANVNAMLELTPGQTLFDVVKGHCKLDEAITTVSNELQVVSAAASMRQFARLDCRECTGLVRAFSDYDRPLDILIVDTATGLSGCTTSFCRAAGEIILVVCNEPDSIRESIAQIEMMSAGSGISRFRILANRVDGVSEGEDVFGQMLAELGDDYSQVLSYAGSIPRDDQMGEAMSGHMPVVSAFPRSRMSLALVKLARQVRAWPRPEQAGGHVEFFVERLIHNENSRMEANS